MMLMEQYCGRNPTPSLYHHSSSIKMSAKAQENHGTSVSHQEARKHDGVSTDKDKGHDTPDMLTA